MIKHLFPTITILVLLAACSGGDTKPVSIDSSKQDSVPVVASAGDSSSIGGVYAFGTDPQKEAVGTVFIHPETDSTFLFYIDFNRGAPSFNMGMLEGRGKIVGDTGRYFYEERELPLPCGIDFYFSKKFVQLITRSNGCGFGANVFVDHVYPRIDLKAPEFFEGPEGDTVYFSNLAKSLH